LNILVISAHPDDEVLGMGGTIKKLTQNGHNVHLCVVSEGTSAQYSDKKMIKVRQNSCKNSSKILGIKNTSFFDFPDQKLDTIPHLEINQELEKIIKKFKPIVVYTTPNNDLNQDHQKVFESTLVATRPFLTSVKQILVYELPSITKFPFHPNVFQDITKEFSYKIKAFKKYHSEIEDFPHTRSIEALESLAIHRGYESGFKKAESFCLIRDSIL
jgi:N-acetylglucosamine malate deacetylase 1